VTWRNNTRWQTKRRKQEQPEQNEQKRQVLLASLNSQKMTQWLRQHDKTTTVIIQLQSAMHFNGTYDDACLFLNSSLAMATDVAHQNGEARGVSRHYSDTN
jgi:hypothetical protein